MADDQKREFPWVAQKDVKTLEKDNKVYSIQEQVDKDNSENRILALAQMSKFPDGQTGNRKQLWLNPFHVKDICNLLIKEAEKVIENIKKAKK